MTLADELVFLRPLWLAGLLLLPLVYLGLRRIGRSGMSWASAVDPHLLRHLLETGSVRQGRGLALLGVLAAAVCLLALAGPSWRQQQLPLWQIESPLVIALDLSAAMRATDLPPSRLVQARAKIEALLDRRSGGQVALIAYADDAFTVAPLTRDGRSLKLLLGSLSPDLMPADGQRGDRAIRHAVGLLRGAGFEQGQILLLADRVDPRAQAAASAAQAAGFRVSALGVGTPGGAPLRGPQGFITDASGQPQLARLDSAGLQAMVVSGAGRYAQLSSDDGDLEALAVLDPLASSAAAAADSSDPATLARRSDDGYWLLLLLLPLALLGFRRGWLAALAPWCLLATLLPTPTLQAQTAPTDSAASQPQSRAADWWGALWQRADQRARAALDRGDAERARALARDQALQAAAAYRAADYESAAQAWDSLDSADAHYNRGNALARAGELQAALDAYDQALQVQPGMDDAIANRAIVEEALRRQPPPSQGDGQPQDGESDSQDGQSADQTEQGQDGQQGEDSSDQNAEDGQQDQADQSGSEQDGVPQDSDQSRDSQEQDPTPSEDGADGEQGEQQSDSSDSPPPPSAAEEAAREAAEAAAREQMQAALDAAESDEQAGEPISAEQRAEQEQRQAVEQWLRRVPDDPGGLLRRKFELEHRRRQMQAPSAQEDTP